VRLWVLLAIKRTKVDGLLFVTLFILAVLPLWSIRFTTADDMSAHVQWLLHGLSLGVPFAEAQGRFMFAYTWPVAAFPYLIDSEYWLFSTRVIGLLVPIVAMSWAARRVFGSSRVANLAAILVLVLTQNGWEHNLITSYPFVFHMYSASYFVSVGLFALSVERRSVLIACGAALFYFFALSSESFVLLAPTYLWLLRYIPRQQRYGKSISTHPAWRCLVPMYLTLFLYLVAYWGWRLIFGGSTYEGNVIDGGELQDMLAVIWHYSVNGLPIQSLMALPSSSQQLLSSSPISIMMLILQSLIATILVVRILRSTHGKPQKNGSLGEEIVALLLAGFLVNALLATNAKYQNWVASGSRSYVLTQYSTYFFVLLLALVAVRLISLRPLNSVSSLVKKRWFAAISIGVFALTLSVGLYNKRFFDEQQSSTQKWTLVDKWIASKEFAKVIPGSTIYAPTLIRHQIGIARTPTTYWPDYVLATANKSIEFSAEPCAIKIDCYFISFGEVYGTREAFLLFGKAATGATVVTDQVSIFFLSVPHNATLQGLRDSNSESNVDVTTVTTPAQDRLGRDYFVADITVEGSSRGWHQIATRGPVIVDSLRVVQDAGSIAGSP